MNDPSSRQGADATQQFRQPYPPYTDPAYAGQPYAPPHYPRMPPSPTATSPTAKFPQSWLQDQHRPGQPTQQLPPDGPKAPRWLWIAAVAAALLVIALVIALVIGNGSARKQTAVPPLPAMPSTRSAPPSSTPSLTPSPTPSGTAAPPPQAGAGATDSVVYNVTGEGRAISITYRDSGGALHIEFNVALPWSREASLAKSGDHANVTIVNIGHNVTCTLTVGGEQVLRHTGVGLTVCDAPA